MIVFADRNTRGTYTHVCEISYSYCVHFKKCSKKESVSFARKHNVHILRWLINRVFFFKKNIPPFAQAPSSLRQRAPPPPQPPPTATTAAATPFATASSPPAAAASSLHSSDPPPPAAARPAAGGGGRGGDRNVSHFHDNIYRILRCWAYVTSY